MGQVYLASTPAGRPVALKVVRRELSNDPEFRARFHQEIEAARRVRGLYTAELVDADPEADPQWLATAYVPGPTLQEFVAANGPISEAEEAFRLIAGVAEALQAIHAANVVHRDLKPSNVVLGPDGPRVIDFGIARALEAAVLTSTGVAVGTPQFMAPEQLQNLPVTPMIDVFALGSLAAYAVLGRSPFGAGPATAVHYRVLHESPDLTGCPPQLLSLIEPCLAKQPADRPQLGQVLQYCLERVDMTGGSMPARAQSRPNEKLTSHQAPSPMTAAVEQSAGNARTHALPESPPQATQQSSGRRGHTALLTTGALVIAAVIGVTAFTLFDSPPASGGTPTKAATTSPAGGTQQPKAKITNLANGQVMQARQFGITGTAPLPPPNSQLWVMDYETGLHAYAPIAQVNPDGGHWSVMPAEMCLGEGAQEIQLDVIPAADIGRVEQAKASGTGINSIAGIAPPLAAATVQVPGLAASTCVTGKS